MSDLTPEEAREELQGGLVDLSLVEEAIDAWEADRADSGSCDLCETMEMNPVVSSVENYWVAQVDVWSRHPGPSREVSITVRGLIRD